MGSQSIAKFDELRKRQIHSRLSRFDPRAEDHDRRAEEAAIAAIKSLAPSSAVAKALTSASVETAAKTLSGLVGIVQGGAAGAKDVLGTYGVDPADRQPYAALVAGLQRKLFEDLTASSRKTDAFPAAEAALANTLLDVVARRFPEPADVNRAELLQAIRATPEPVFTRAFVKNFLTSYLWHAFDATRGDISKGRVGALMKSAEPAIERLAIYLTEVHGK